MSAGANVAGMAAMTNPWTAGISALGSIGGGMNGGPDFLQSTATQTQGQQGVGGLTINKDQSLKWIAGGALLVALVWVIRSK